MTHAARRVLVVDDDAAHREMLMALLGDLGAAPEGAADGEAALAVLARERPDLVLLDMRMPGLDGLGTLAAMQARGLSAPTIVLTAHAGLDDAVRAMKLGAVDYLRKPIDVATLQALLDDHAPRASAGAVHPPLPPGVVAESPLMAEVLADLARVAASDATLLLTGETGTGKDVLARVVHGWSARATGPFVALNLAAVPEALVADELFGHEVGAFTGADRARAGRLESAHGGTLFLDEIGDAPLSVQPKLLRVLQEGAVTRLGARDERRTDFRLVSATHRDLDAAVATGAFREDLYYRLAVITIEVPPLRERREDVLPLARAFLALRGTKQRLSPAAEGRLLTHEWRGNVRELQGAIARASVLAPGDVILPEHLPPRVVAARESDADGAELTPDLSLAARERDAILLALERCSGNRTEAARALGISRRKLLYRLKQYRETGRDV